MKSCLIETLFRAGKKTEAYTRMFVLLESAEKKLNQCGSAIPVAEREQKKIVRYMDNIECQLSNLDEEGHDSST